MKFLKLKLTVTDKKSLNFSSLEICADIPLTNTSNIHPGAL